MGKNYSNDQTIATDNETTAAGLPDYAVLEVNIDNIVTEAAAKVIEEQNKDPNTIKEIIKEKHNTELKIAQEVNEWYNDLKKALSNNLEKITEYKQKSNNNIFRNHIPLINEMLQDIEDLQKSIVLTTNEINRGVSKVRDKQFYAAYDNNKLFQDINFLEDLYVPIKENYSLYKREWPYVAPDYINIYSPDQLQLMSKQIKDAKKIWQALSKVKNDDDRLYSYKKLSDNIASSLTNTNNWAYSITNILMAMLEYAALDVICQAALKGAGKGLKEGFNSGLKTGMNTVKGVAKNLNKISQGIDKQLNNAINAPMQQDGYPKVIQGIINSYLNPTLNPNKNIASKAQGVSALLKLFVAVDCIDQINNIRGLGGDERKAIKGLSGDEINAISMLQNNDIAAIAGLENQAKECINVHIQALDQAIELYKQRDALSSYLPTQAAARLTGVAFGVVNAIRQAAWTPMKQTFSAVTKSKRVVKVRYEKSKPEKGTEWNKDFNQVKEKRRNQQKAKTIIKHSNWLEKENKRKAEAAKHPGGTSINH
ncbi:MAG: hypothetical protein H6909_04655 [Rickettsiaceae bacterium]|nr:hypothetical protein [Rickettsiaceae bacterium]